MSILNLDIYNKINEISLIVFNGSKMVYYKRGDLFELADLNSFDIILNGCNCFNHMRKGINHLFARKYPEVLLADLVTIKGDKNKLGSFIPVAIKRNNYEFLILNCYVQYSYSGLNLDIHDFENTDYFDYDAYVKILQDISKKYNNKRIGMPLIGTGSTGGDIEKITQLTEKYLKNNKVTVVVFSDFVIPKKFYSLKNKLFIFCDELKN